MRKDLLKVAALAALVAALGGCRFKSWESFTSATTPNPAPNWGNQFGEHGDPGSYGGIADASGGIETNGVPPTRQNWQAQNSPNNPVNPRNDQPNMGTGLNDGEYNGAAAPGYGRSNAPINQPQPGSVGAPNVTAAP